MSNVRKVSKFQTCEEHSWLDGETRYRRGEFFVEGGPASGGPCRGGQCRLWPGTDLFAEDICQGGAEFPLDWAVNGGQEGTPIGGVPRADVEASQEARYPEECTLLLANGMQLRVDGHDADGASYVRVCDPSGVEIAYWCSDEWRDAPEEVMGAITGALARVTWAVEDRYS